MILLKSLKVNGDLQVFKFKGELFNLNKINIVKREIKRYLKRNRENNSNIVEYVMDALDKVKNLISLNENNEEDYYIVALKRIMGNTNNYVDEIRNEVRFLKDIYTKEEIHNKLKEVNKV